MNLKLDRYSRQVLVIGTEGQQRLADSCAVIIGCGALGTVVATSLVRAGVGNVRIIDRDFIEYHNLQRQILFNEEDVVNRLPKAVAAARHLKKVNSSVNVEGIVADVNHSTVERLVDGADVILDGLDNFETRLLINDVSLKHGIPWIYGGAISYYGMTMTILPGKPPCFRCFTPDPAKRGVIETCDTIGVISPAPFIIGSLETAEAMKVLVGEPAVNRNVLVIDVWNHDFQSLTITPRGDCPACGGTYEFLDGRSGWRTTVLCGQNAVQVSGPEKVTVSFEELAARLEPLGEVSFNKYLLRFSDGTYELVVFADGRAIVNHTSDESLAKGLYARYIGM